MLEEKLVHIPYFDIWIPNMVRFVLKDPNFSYYNTTLEKGFLFKCQCI